MQIPPSSHSQWLRNCWYVIAWNHEIPPAHSAELFTRTVLSEPIVVYRLADGSLVALEDCCPHRFAPLSKGRREGDDLRCGYHGLKFNSQGACVQAPGLPLLPAKACVKNYPVRLHKNWVFVWMGESVLADNSLLPNNFSCDNPDWQHQPGYMHYRVPYLLVCDNLLDFSHLSYVHEKTLGGTPRIAQTMPTIEPVAGPNAAWAQIGIKVSRHIADVPPPPFYQRFRNFDTNLDRWFVYDFLLPGTLLMHSGGRPVTDATDDMTNAVQLHSCQTLTPETETSTHYFFQQSHPAGHGDATVTESIYNSLLQAFEEDRNMITSQYRSILLNPDSPMLPLAMDSALIQFRRLLSSRAALEAASPFFTHSTSIGTPR